MPTDPQSATPTTNRTTVIGLRAELVLDARAELAEGPLWDEDRHVIWWVDINAGRVHRLDPATGSDSAIEIGRPVGCIALRQDGALVVAAPESLLTLNPETGATGTLARFEPEPIALRCNDGKPDPRGRFWIDRMAFDRAPGAGSLVRYGRSGPGSETGFETVLRGLTIPNGLDWSGDGANVLRGLGAAGHLGLRLRRDNRADRGGPSFCSCRRVPGPACSRGARRPHDRRGRLCLGGRVGWGMRPAVRP